MSDILDEYSGLVKKIAKSACYSSSAIDVSDLCQVGFLAVLRAIKSYDPTCGANIKSYVAKAVRRDIYNEAARFLGVFTVDRRITHLASKVSQLSAQGKTDDEIATILSCDKDDVRDLRFIYDRRQTFDIIDNPTEGSFLEEKNILELLADTTHNDIEYVILQNRILANVPVVEVATMLGVSTGRVYEIESYLKERIKRAIEDSVI